MPIHKPDAPGDAPVGAVCEGHQVQGQQQQQQERGKVHQHRALKTGRELQQRKIKLQPLL